MTSLMPTREAAKAGGGSRRFAGSMHEGQENNSRIVRIHLIEGGITGRVDGFAARGGIRSLRWHEGANEPIEVARSGSAVVCDQKAFGIKCADPPKDRLTQHR